MQAARSETEAWGTEYGVPGVEKAQGGPFIRRLSSKGMANAGPVTPEVASHVVQDAQSKASAETATKTSARASPIRPFSHEA
jgi:hypothetical protein